MQKEIQKSWKIAFKRDEEWETFCSLDIYQIRIQWKIPIKFGGGQRSFKVARIQKAKTL